jgi:hypothetical protein
MNEGINHPDDVKMNSWLRGVTIVYANICEDGRARTYASRIRFS